ncbi:hypothetical protein L6452_17737 [Arctium lappa]|uniref:Uncharacterized protein n=1 Tax=Arctium lappa TaxID=4217 RepID=A0ACB9C488_ARCLA|nr:hypothetical protein L6452_17737 [Arctium lappa]
MNLHHLASWNLEPQNLQFHLPHQVHRLGARVEVLDWVFSESLIIFNGFGSSRLEDSSGLQKSSLKSTHARISSFDLFRGSFHLPHQVHRLGARVEVLDWVFSESLVIFNGFGSSRLEDSSGLQKSSLGEI